MSLLNNSNAIPTTGGVDYNLENSLRFRSSASAYLSRTPATAGNQQTWTWSGWVKRGKVGASQQLFASDNSGTSQARLGFNATDSLFFITYIGALQISLTTTQVFRDPSAWYHIVLILDTTNATASNRVKMYVNGVQVTAFSTATYPAQNYSGVINSTLAHFIGTFFNATSGEFLDGYLTEVNFVDGQALTPSDFGDYNEDTGVWQPIKYTGTYGTNGFYLPFKPTTQATGFNTVLYTGNGGTNAITGVGFEPDFVWAKSRAVEHHCLFDSVRGIHKLLYSNLTNPEDNATTSLLSFDSDGFTLGSNTTPNTNGNAHVAWCWDAGSGSPVSNTDGTITSTVKANPATGFSVITYTGTGVAGSIGHGLGVVPKLYIIKQRTDAGNNWIVQTTAVDGSLDYLFLNSTAAKGDSGDALPTSSVINISGNNDVNGSGDGIVAYTFADVAGYQKIGSYTGNGISNGPTVTTGFRPAFIIMKSTNATDSWAMVDNRRHPSNDPLCPTLLADGSAAELTAYPCVDFLDDGFKLVGNPDIHNYSGRNYIYIAIADTTDAQFNFDASGNKNNWEANNINSNASGDTTYDIMSDVPTLTDEDTANYATLNPLDAGTILITVSNANLKFGVSGNSWTAMRATIGVSSGKWYWEITPLTAPVANYFMNGIKDVTESIPAGTSQYVGDTSGSYGYHGVNGNKYNNSSSAAYGATYGVGDVIGVALDMDAGTLTFYKNNVSQGVAYSGLTGTFAPGLSMAGGTGQENTEAVNFGQRPFTYTPPTGYKKLNTFNLPDSSIVDGSENMDVNTWDGNGTSQSFNIGFSPDFTWVKSRSTTFSHALYDTVRGDYQRLQSNTTNAESDQSPDDVSFDVDGFSIGGGGAVNQAGQTYVAWNWKAGGTAVSNTDGTITSSVSANPTAGFSIVTYSGVDTPSTNTVGHGLNNAPELVILKNRSSSTNWYTFTTLLSNPVDYALLNLTNAFAQQTVSPWNTPPTSSVFTLGANNADTCDLGSNYVAYCFASVEGYSKFGSYTGNGSADGPFVYTGFRPAFVMGKRTDAIGSWIIIDSSRSLYNATNVFLNPDTSAAEGSASEYYDLLSNGFKLKYSGAMNVSGGTYIYMAFAENPFKNSLAR